MTFSERLHVPWSWILIGVAIVASLGIAIIAYVPAWLGVLCTLVAAAVTVGALLTYSSTRLTVDEATFRAGRYCLERRYIASATALIGQAAAAAMGPEADHRAFLLTRPYLRDAVRVDLDDDADPHPYWLVSTRRAKELAAALRGQL